VKFGMSQYKKKNLSLFIRNYTYPIFTIGITMLALSLIGALGSYNAQDPSWFYFNTQATIIHNKFGSFGANSAALLLYLTGAAAWLWVISVCFAAYVSIRKQWRYEWDRFIAAAVVCFDISLFFSFYNIRLIAHFLPGGITGAWLYRMGVKWFDKLGTGLAIYMILVSSTIVLSRVSIAQIGAVAQAGMRLFLSKDRFWMPIYRTASTILYWITRPLVLFGGWLWHIISGKTVESEADQAVQELERDLYHGSTSYDTMPDQSFWEQINRPAPPNYSAQSKPKTTKSKETFSSNIDIQKEENDLATHEYQSDENNYTLPDLDIFIGVDEEKDDPRIMQELENRAAILVEKLERFGIAGKVTAIKRGPVVTLFEYQPDIDAKISKILALEDDLALALKALSIRILAPIPGRSVVGFEVANTKRKSVLFAHAASSPIYRNFEGALPLILGEDTVGNQVVVDLAKMPHLLIAGSTGSGKSVALNTMLMSLLCKHSPDDLKLILIDPKRLEFSSYTDIAHLLFPIVTHPKKAAPVLRWVVHEMERRYELLAECGARNIFDYHKQTAYDASAQSMPFIAVIIDELADLMMTAGKEVEDLITRITQMARAAGIHMIIATQRPSVDVITGLIKVNFPSRISFRVTSKIDSRTILDCMGAEKLLGRGDMLFLDSHQSVLRRVHGAYVSDEQINQIADHIRSERLPEYLDISEQQIVAENDMSDADEQLYTEVLGFLDTVEEVSISLLQRKFRIGYNRSARVIDLLEQRGMIAPPDGSKTRKVIR